MLSYKWAKKKKKLSLATLRSKRFLLVSGQTKTEEGDFRFWQRERQKLNDGVPFFARSLTLVPGSLLRNRTETFASQATVELKLEQIQFLGAHSC